MSAGHKIHVLVHRCIKQSRVAGNRMLHECVWLRGSLSALADTCCDVIEKAVMHSKINCVGPPFKEKQFQNGNGKRSSQHLMQPCE